jgi:hypothetical protein
VGGFLIAALVWAVSFVASLFMPQPKPQKPQPGELSGAPVAQAGKPIPVLFGSRRIKQANCIWWGNVRTAPIKKKGGGK